MAETVSPDFAVWLYEKLRGYGTDESALGSYIIGILGEESETAEEKAEAMEGILCEIIDKSLQEIITEIFNKWEEYHPKETASSKNATQIDVNEQLARLLEAQKLPTIKEREYSAEERKIKEQILAQYSQTEIEEEEYEGSEDETTKQNGPKASSSSGLEKNTNVQDVMQLQKERREQARQDSAAKKQKDKEDREKQRQLREEKKEKRKTVKGERRR